MTLSIGLRLFGAVLLSYFVLGATGLGLARWQLSDGAPPARSQADANALEALVAELQARYVAQGDWSFLPSDVSQRRNWLRIELRRLWFERPEGSAEWMTPTLGSRLGLVDAAGRTIAGIVPSRALIAAASIDTRSRTVTMGGTPVGRLIESRSDNPDDELAIAFLLEQQLHLAIVGGAALLLSLPLAAGLAAHFRRPILQLLKGARALESGRFGVRLPTGRTDEFGQLSAAFNQLAARLEEAEQARTQWVADTSHELRTPLAVVSAQIEALQDGIRPSTPEQFDVMLRQILALTRLVDDLGALAQPAGVELGYAMHRVAVWPLIEDVAASFEERARRAGLELDVVGPPFRSAVRGDALRLRQVVSNLLENSLRYTAPGGRIQIRAESGSDYLRITMADTAPGVPAHCLHRLGERFFRVEPSRDRASGGAGLGLALCRRIVDGHGGRIEFSAASLGGLRVDVLLPLEN